MVGDAPLTDALVAEHTDYTDISAFAKAIAADESTVKAIPDLKRVFRLHPPRGAKGWGGIKRSFVVGGALGSRGSEIGALVERMI
jgi:large subunit ribosomal protein L30